MFEYLKTKKKPNQKNIHSTKSIDISKSNITKQLNLNLGKKEYLIINNLKLQKKKNQITLNNSKTNFNFLVKNQKTRSISPLNIDIIKKPNENTFKNKKTNLTMPNSVLDSPNRSYNKIILNLKTEFEEITRKTHSKDSKEKENKATSLNNSNYFYRNSNNNILILNKKKENKKYEINRRFIPLRNKKKEKNSINNCSINNIFLGTNITFCKNYSIIKENNFSLLSYKNINEKKNEKLEKEIIDYKIMIKLLKEYIHSQIKVFTCNSRKYNKEFLKKESLKKIKILEEEVKKLSQFNQSLKLICFNLFYQIEESYNSSLEREKKIRQIISQLLNENIYLRELSKSVRIINNESISLKENTFKINFNKSKESTNESFIKKIKSTEDIFSKLLVTEMENTIKRDDKNKRNKSRIKKSFNKNQIYNNKIIKKSPCFKYRRILYNIKK